jgi:hypothetical protein
VIYGGNLVVVQFFYYLSKKYKKVALISCEIQSTLFFISYVELLLYTFPDWVDTANYPAISALIGSVSIMSHN